MEVLAFLGAVVGLVTAIINRKRIIVFRHESVAYRPPQEVQGRVTIRKRLKRLAICFFLGFVCAVIGSSTQNSSKGLSDFMAWPCFLCALLGSYQALAIVLMCFARLWR